MRVDPRQQEEELMEYLGSEFDPVHLQLWEQTLDREWDECGDEESFYRTSQAYLYNLTAFAMSGTKDPYLTVLTRLVEPPARLLDYGCGIGSDGLALIEAGYRVEFADFDNPSVEYLRWRLRRRGLEAAIHDLDQGVPGGFDASYAFDVIEHVSDPLAFLGEMESRSDLVMVNLLEGEDDERPYHRELPIGDIVRRAADHGLREYRIFHRISHLIAYSSESDERSRSWGTRRMIARERLRRRLALHRSA